MNNIIIDVKNISKTFTIQERTKKQVKRIDAVKGMSFSINKGEKVAFMGPNGAGKSTTIKMLTGILTPSQGEILVNGIDPQKDVRKLAKSIGTVFGQREQLWINLTPYENFIFLAMTYGIAKNDAKQIIKDFEKIFDMESIMNVPIKKLSLGQRMKCEIIAGLVHKPQILFLDEPTIGLDIVAKNSILKVIDRMNKEYSTTVFFTSHDVSDIEKLCDRVIIVNEGGIVIDDYLEDIKKNYFKKKNITITLLKELSNEIVNEYSVENVGNNKYLLPVSNDELDIGKIILKVGAENIIDITIQDTSLETVISDIYTSMK